MKKTFLLLSAGVLLASCGSGYQPDGPDQVKQPTAASPEPAAQPAADASVATVSTTPVSKPAGKGAQLISASDCLGCHREREKLIGPAYSDVAAKYPATPANIAMLSKRVIAGGSGHWGEIAMSPHPNLSESDSKEMVSYVLSLK